MPKSPTHRIKSTIPKGTDLYSKHGAGLLADLVMAAWVKRGVGHVVATIEPIPGRKAHWGVTSNLVAGMPPPRKPRGRPVSPEASMAARTLSEKRQEFLR